MRTAVICCVYNTLPVARQAIEAAVRLKRGDTDVFLVDNHSPDIEVRKWVAAITQPPTINIFRLNPGRNLGCHNGWNYGYHGAKCAEFALNRKYDFFAKLDDDTVVQTEGWDVLLGEALSKLPHFSHLTADGDCQRKYEYMVDVHNSVQIKRAPDPAHQWDVSFSLAFFKRQTIEEFGQMRNALYLTAESRPLAESSLYGGEESYYGALARQCGKLTGILPTVFWHHLGNEERHPDYPWWKLAHGFFGWTTKDMESWTKSPECGEHYEKMLAWAWQQKPPNDVYLRDICARLKVYGTAKALRGLAIIAEQSANGVVKEAAIEAEKAIKGRTC